MPLEVKRSAKILKLRCNGTEADLLQCTHTSALEVRVGPRWGTVCPIDESDAQVVCRSLGLAGGASAKFANGPLDPVVLLRCAGNESRVAQCEWDTTATGRQCGYYGGSDDTDNEVRGRLASLAERM